MKYAVIFGPWMDKESIRAPRCVRDLFPMRAGLRNLL